MNRYQKEFLDAFKVRSVNYPFEYPEEAFVHPPADILDRIAKLEEQVGAIPLSVCAWYEIVGSVNFIPADSEWAEDLSDPIYVNAADDTWGYDEQNWHRGHYILYISPDDYHKADVSGGPPYEVVVPNASADATLEKEKHKTTFVDYMRLCFRSGGFPGRLRESALRQWTLAKPELIPI